MYCTSGLLAYPAPRVGSLSDPVYPPAAYATPAGQGYMSFGTESSAFYTPLSGDTTDAWRSLSQPSGAVSSGWPYDSSMCGYPYGTSYGGLDVRRKNATRESTSTLKAWLYEHIKNPYPTKGEKIMLAIITKMTLTQVSTWFANARRRLKKENKMQWSPRNRTENDDDDKTSSDDDDDDGADGKDGGKAGGGTGTGGGGGGCQKKPQSRDDDEDVVVDKGGGDELTALPSASDCSLSDLASPPRGSCSAKYSSGPLSSQDSLIHPSKAIPEVAAGLSTCCSHQEFLSPCGVTSIVSSSSSRLDHPFYYTLGGKPPSNMIALGAGSLFSRSPLSSLPSADESIEMKPRIWSLADVATSRPSHPQRHSALHQRPSGQLGLTVVGGQGMTGGLSCLGGVNGTTLGQNFQPWANGGYCDDTSSHFTSASPYAAMTSHAGAMTLPFDKAHCDAAIGRIGQAGPPPAATGLNGVRRLSTSGQHSGHYSCRLASMASQENTEIAGKVAAAAAVAAHAGSDLNLMIGLNGTRYPHQSDCPASAVSASNTAFKPFPKRL